MDLPLHGENRSFPHVTGSSKLPFLACYRDHFSYRHVRALCGFLPRCDSLVSARMKSSAFQGKRYRAPVGPGSSESVNGSRRPRAPLTGCTAGCKATEGNAPSEPLDVNRGRPLRGRLYSGQPS